MILEKWNEHDHKKCDEKVLSRQNIINYVKRKSVEDFFAQQLNVLHIEFKI